MKTPESYEKEDIKKYLRRIGAYFILPRSGGFGASGTPDIVALIRGTFWGIEVKREGKEPTKLQVRRMKEIAENGGMAAAGTAEVVIKKIEEWWGK